MWLCGSRSGRWSVGKGDEGCLTIGVRSLGKVETGKLEVSGVLRVGHGRRR